MTASAPVDAVTLADASSPASDDDDRQSYSIFRKY